MPAAHILIFDSGLGGSTVLKNVHVRLPHCQFSYALDDAWFPYGEKSDADLLQRILAYFDVLLEQINPDLVVIACNTASTLALESLRQRFDVPFVGVVPAIKPAVALSRTKVVGLLATPATIKRDYVDRLLTEHGAGCLLIKFSCPSLVTLAEDKMRGKTMSPTVFQQAVADIKAQAGAHDVDVFVLGCTHFPALKNELAECWPEHVQWLDSGAAIARRVESVLSDGGVGKVEAGKVGAGKIGVGKASITAVTTVYVTGSVDTAGLLALFQCYGLQRAERIQPSVVDVENRVV